MNGKELLEALQQCESWELRDWDLFAINEGDATAFDVVDLVLDKEGSSIVLKLEES